MNTTIDQELQTLLEEPQGTCISIYLSVDRLGLTYKQNVNQLGKLLRQAKNELIMEGLTGTEINSLLKPAITFLNSHLVQQEREDGLALFCSNKLFKFFWIPYQTGNLLLVGKHFYIKPLLHLFNDNRRFFILALSQNAVRLLEATHYSVRELTLPPDVPVNLKEASKYVIANKELEFHSGPVLAGRGGRPLAVYYGHGGPADIEKENLLLYFYQIDRGLQSILHNQHAPLVFAGVNYLFPIYRQANTYLHLIEQPVTGNPDDLSSEKLHQKAWAIVQPYFILREKEAVAKYYELSTKGLTSDDVKEIVVAAHQGRVAQLFVATNRLAWGDFNPTNNVVSQHPNAASGDEELLNLAIIQTLTQKGIVYPMPAERVPGSQTLAAIFRY